jgi:hypothetical protein
VSAFSDPEIIRMAQEDYVPVVGDDWYQRRRDDPEGKFFRQVADQGPRKGEGGATRQGIYCLTASGKLLAFGNNSDPTVMREMIRKGLNEWSRLPEEQRRPGAVQLEKRPTSDSRYSRSAPEGGLILNVYTRILDHDGKGEVCKGTCQTTGGDRAARDHMWLTRSEWESLIPANPIKGNSFPLPKSIADRLARFHLVDNTRGEPPSWELEEVRKRKLDVIIENVTDVNVLLRLEGKVLLATKADLNSAERGFDARLLGYLRFNRRQQKFDRFDMLVIGEHWGQGHFTEGARPGRSPLGIVFELAQGDAPGDQVPPQGARDIDQYFAATKVGR